MPTWHILPILVTIILQFLWISCQDFSFLISVAIALICGKVRPLCTVNLLLCFPQNSHPSSKIIICQISSQDMYHYDSMCNNCNWFKSLYSMTHFGLFVSVLQNWIQLHVSVICSFSPRGYSRIEEMRKCQSHDLTAFILENKSKEKEGGKEKQEYRQQFTKLNIYISHQFHDKKGVSSSLLFPSNFELFSFCISY